MEAVVHTMQLDWKEFNLDLNTIQTWMKANAGDDFAGCSADTSLRLHFTAEPSDEIKETIQDHWDNLSEESDEATAYMSQEDRATAAATARASAIASATAKLETLGLSAQEIAAILGK